MELKQPNCAASKKTAIAVMRIKVASVVSSQKGRPMCPCLCVPLPLNPRLGWFSMFCVKAGLASAVGISCYKLQVWWCPYV